MTPSFPANSPFSPPVGSFVISPYDANGNWVGIGNGVPVEVGMTDQLYYNAQPLAVQALIEAQMQIGTARTKAFAALAAQGYSIDEEIMVLGQSPTVITAQRVQYGYTWVPQMLSANVTLAPGLTFPGVPSYNPLPPFPPGSIVVSLAASQYLAVKPPAVPVPAVPYVGSYVGNGYYIVSEAAQSLFQNGQGYTDPVTGIKYVFIVGSMGAFGKTYFWTLAPTNQ
jgi:hypothetical protein